MKEITPNDIPREVHEYISGMVFEGHKKTDYTISEILQLLDFLVGYEGNKAVAQLIEDIRNHTIDTEYFNESYFINFPVWPHE